VTLPADVDDLAPGAALRWSVASPVRGPATMRLSLPRDGETSVCVYDSAGRRMRTLLRERLAAGAHTVVWDGRDEAGRACPAGVYHCRLVSDGVGRSAKLVLVR